MRPTIKEIATRANNFARKQIRTGSSQLENNHYEHDKQQALGKAVEDVRTLLIESFHHDPLRLESDNRLELWNKQTALISKYSLGNCLEYAMLALKYVMQAAPHANAELYQIQNGDHGFLVIGRDPDSNPFAPLTWGKDAFICDPWADKVYLASDYMTELKNYYWEEESKHPNKIEDFDPEVHTLAPYSIFSSTLCQASTRNELIPDIIEIYQMKVQVIINALEKLKADLASINENIKSQYSESDSKYKVLMTKQNDIGAIIKKLKLEKAQATSSKDYDEAHAELREKLKDAIKQFRGCYTFTSKAHNTLNHHRHGHFLKTQAGRIFKIAHPTTLDETNKAFGKATKRARKISKILS